MTPCKNGTIRRRIKFWVQHKQLENQHKSSSESGADFTYVKNQFFQVKLYFLFDNPLWK